MSYSLNPRSSSGDELKRVVLEHLDKALWQLREGLSEDSDKAVHTARKQLKKARSATRLTRSSLKGKRRKEVNRLVRDAGRALSDARDTVARLETIEEIRGEGDLPVRAGEAFDRMSSSYPSGREPEDLRSVAGEATRQVELAHVKVSAWAIEGGGFGVISKGLEREYRRGRKAMKEVQGDPTDANVHAWRKRAKDHWYHLRLLEETWPSVLGKTAKQAHELADLLGDHHDLAVLRAKVGESEELSKSRGVGALKVIRLRQQALLEEAIPLGRRLYAEKPKAWKKRAAFLWLATANSSG